MQLMVVLMGWVVVVVMVTSYKATRHWMSRVKVAATVFTNRDVERIQKVVWEVSDYISENIRNKDWRSQIGDSK